MKKIDSLIKLFRKFEGKFENAELAYNEQCGFYCYTHDSSLVSIVSCPSNLLVDIDDVGISEEGLFVSGADKYGSNMVFLEKYFSFHFGKRMVSQYVELENQIGSLSQEDTVFISKVFPPYAYTTNTDKKLECVKNRIINAHKINYMGRKVLMPFVTFLNYSKNGRPYRVSDKGISVSGKFENEIAAYYSYLDTLAIACEYGFVAATDQIYSIPLKMNMRDDTTVIISRHPNQSASTSEGYPRPLVKKENNIVYISWFPLYIEGHPEYPASVSEMIANETGLPADRLIKRIFEINFRELKPAEQHLRNSLNPFSRMVASAALVQLKVFDV